MNTPERRSPPLLGIAIGVASVIAIGMASVIAILVINAREKQKVIDQISAMGTNMLIVRPGAPNQHGRDITATLVIGDVAAIAELDNVSAAVPEQSTSVTLRVGNTDHRTSVNATSANYIDAREWKVARGTFFSEQDETRYAAVAVLGQTVANALFSETDPVGQFVLVNNIPFQVVGVMTAKGATGWGQDQDNVVFIPYPTGSTRVSRQRFLGSITIAVEDVARIDETEAAVHALLLARHGLEDFQISSLASIIDTISETQNTHTIGNGSNNAPRRMMGGARL